MNIQLTLEQQEFELHGCIYMWIFKIPSFLEMPSPGNSTLYTLPFLYILISIQRGGPW